MDKIAERSTPRQCLQCEKRLRAVEIVYEYDRGPPYDKRKVGEKPALNAFAPFCSLRCGWRWAKEHAGRKK